MTMTTTTTKKVEKCIFDKYTFFSLLFSGNIIYFYWLRLLWRVYICMCVLSTFITDFRVHFSHFFLHICQHFDIMSEFIDEFFFFRFLFLCLLFIFYFFLSCHAILIAFGTLHARIAGNTRIIR